MMSAERPRHLKYAYTRTGDDFRKHAAAAGDFAHLTNVAFTFQQDYFTSRADRLTQTHSLLYLSFIADDEGQPHRP